MISLGQATVSLELRELFRAGVALRVGTRAFDILEMLIEHQGQLVSKDALLQRIWPDTVVEENNLQVHISALRKVLGEDRDLIRTVPGRGYLLLGAPEHAPLVTTEASWVSAQPAVVAPHAWLPARTGLIGRDTLLDEVRQAMDDCPLVTLTGPGGVGKTALAATVGQRIVEAGVEPVYFVSLAELSDAEQLPQALASALGFDVGSAEPCLDALLNHLIEHPCVIILDNAEHLIEAVAMLAENLLRGCPGIRLLATSREPLRIAPERSLRVPPLAVAAAACSRQEILDSPAVQLFIGNVQALDGCQAYTSASEPDTHSLNLIGQVCRRLGGMPLALEMAAARACTLGLFELLASLDANLHLLSAGLRTAAARHQSLLASFDWSERLLNDDERKVLTQLVELPGRFTLEQACDALVCSRIGRSRVMDCIVGLALKSMLMVSAQGPFRFYHVLEETRRCVLSCIARDLSSDPESIPASPPPDAMTLMALRENTPLTPGPNGYHASHQRVLAISR